MIKRFSSYQQCFYNWGVCCINEVWWWYIGGVDGKCLVSSAVKLVHRSAIEHSCKTTLEILLAEKEYDGQIINDRRLI